MLEDKKSCDLKEKFREKWASVFNNNTRKNYTKILKRDSFVGFGQ